MSSTQSMREDPEHREVWLLIPWLVNDSLSVPQRERVDAHARDCAACHAEIAQQRAIHSAMSIDPGVEVLPSAALNRLRQRLEPRPDETQATRGSGRDMRGQRLLAAAAIAGVAVVLGVLLMRPAQDTAGKSDGAYRTVSSAAPRSSQESIRAVFAPDTTVARLQSVLDSTHLRIISGPTEAGVYSLALTGDQQVTTALAQLRQQPDVRFAESTAPLAPGGSQ